MVLCPGVDIWFGEVLLGPGRRSASWSGLRDFGKWQLFYWLGRSCRGVLELIVLFALLETSPISPVAVLFSAMSVPGEIVPSSPSGGMSPLEPTAHPARRMLDRSESVITLRRIDSLIGL